MPADVPVQQVARTGDQAFKIAKALGLTAPLTLLARGDEKRNARSGLSAPD
jgi:hypothetical protein